MNRVKFQRFEQYPLTNKQDWWTPGINSDKPHRPPPPTYDNSSKAFPKKNKTLINYNGTIRSTPQRFKIYGNGFECPVADFTPKFKARLLECQLLREKYYHEYKLAWWWSFETDRQKRRAYIKDGYRLVCRKPEGRVERRKDQRHRDAEQRKIDLLRESARRHKEIEDQFLEIGENDDWKALSFYDGYEKGAPYNVFKEPHEPPGGFNREQFKKWKQAAKTQQRGFSNDNLAWLKEMDPIVHKKKAYMPKQTKKRRLETIDQKVEFAISSVGGWAYLSDVPELVREKYGDDITASQTRRVKDRLVKAGRATTEEEYGPHGKKIIIRLFYEKPEQGLPIAPIAEGVESASE